MRFFFLFVLSCLPSVVFADFKSQPAPDGAVSYILSPQDGESISGDVKVVFGLKGFGVAPAGTNNPKTGHHHLLIDLKEIPALDTPLPANEHVKHFGGGQTETTLTLPKGTHTLQLVVGDYLHIPHTPPIASQKITITVQ